MPHPSRSLVLLSPLSGVLVPLEQVPDPVFAGKIMGEGIAVAPSDGLLVAPCNGIVRHMHEARHALTLTSAEGVDILMHIGIDTVALKGQGFTPNVAVGDAVRAGDTLVTFDLAFVSANAPSALTVMVVPPTEKISTYVPANGRVVAGKHTALQLVLADAQGEVATDAAHKGTALSVPLVLENPAGLHARPAAVLARCARNYAADIALVKGAREANAKSVVSLLALEVRQGDNVVVRASGTDAEAAVAAMLPLLAASEKALDQRDSFALCPPVVPSPAGGEPPADAGVFVGIPASAGLAEGVVVHFRYDGAVVVQKGSEREEEERALAIALEAVREELRGLAQSMTASRAENAAVFTAHETLLDDPELVGAAQRGIAQGNSAAFAWREAFVAQAEMLASMPNAMLAARSGDIRDVGRRVLRRLAGKDTAPLPAFPAMPENAIVVAGDVTPSEVAGLLGKIRGLCMTGGSPLSHASLFARSSGLPVVVGIDARIRNLADGTKVVLDGDAGVVRADPDVQVLEKARAAQGQRAAQRRQDMTQADLPAVTADGFRIKVVANIGSEAEALDAVRYGGEGVGVLRSEFLFLRRGEAPSEDEQARVYTAIAKTLGPERDLVLRTLDAGGDKPLAYLPMPAEDNPFLGVRGIRLSFADTRIFGMQIRAALRAAPFTRLHLMFPMVAHVEELRRAKAIVAREKATLGVEAEVRTGIMVEVPSVALLAENLAPEVDFFSIGTNDLTQYVLAADRGNPRLDPMPDALHPAVLRLVAMTVEGAHKQGKWAGVCGGIAADPDAVPVLLGLGVDELSVPSESIPAIKAVVRRQSLERCRILAADALAMLSAADVRAYLGVFSTEAASAGNIHR